MTATDGELLKEASVLRSFAPRYNQEALTFLEVDTVYSAQKSTHKTPELLRSINECNGMSQRSIVL